MSDYSKTVSYPLLQTKLFQPVLRAEFVSRPRLIDRINVRMGYGMQNGNARLTLVCAPAGFGKTTLVCTWLAQATGIDQAWLSLDESDNDPVRFLAYLIAALQIPMPGAGQTAVKLLQSPQPAPAETVLTLLINDINQNDRPIILVLDDYQVIASPPVHLALTFLVEHQPPSLQLLINTRSDPPLPLSRLRAQDQMLEVRADDLRFSLDEVGQFFSQVMGLSLAHEDLVALEQRTEGWIAGLQLAALSMQGRDDRHAFIAAFTGSNRYILDYLTDEVLEHRPRGSKNFLLQTSILSHLCGPLCEEVTGQSGGQTTLERLERANLFLIPLDEDRHWYRYHHLFAEVLRRRLQQEQAAHIPELHHKACLWLEKNGLTHEAVNHALAAEDFDQAAMLIERIHGDKWQTGEMKTLQSWLAALPEASWQHHPRLWLVQAWAAMTVGDFERSEEMLQGAETALNELDQETAYDLRAEVTGFRACHASLIQDPGAVPLAQKALQDLPANYWLRGMLVVFLSAAYYTKGDLDAAEDTLNLAPAAAPLDGLQPHQIHLLAFGGIIQHAKGQLQKAHALVNEALQLAEPSGEPIPYIGTLMAYMAASLIFFELGELDLVETYLDRCLDLAVTFGSAEVQIFALSGLVRLDLARGDPAAAAAYTGQIDALLEAHIYNLSITSYVRYHRLQLLLQQGDLTTAETWAQPPAGWPGFFNAYTLHRFAEVQLLTARGHFEQALEKVQALSAEAEDSGHISLLIKALILKTLAFHGSGDDRQTQEALEQAMALGEGQGFVGVFVEEGVPLRALILEYRAVLAARYGPEPDGRARRQLAYTQKLLAAFPLQRETTAVQEADHLDPLSERELEVLGLVATGASNREIADTLVLAVPTVKKHVSNILSKLHAASRTQAVAEARRLGML